MKIEKLLATATLALGLSSQLMASDLVDLETVRQDAILMDQALKSIDNCTTLHASYKMQTIKSDMQALPQSSDRDTVIDAMECGIRAFLDQSTSCREKYDAVARESRRTFERLDSLERNLERSLEGKMPLADSQKTLEGVVVSVERKRLNAALTDLDRVQSTLYDYRYRRDQEVQAASSTAQAMEDKIKATGLTDQQRLDAVKALAATITQRVSSSKSYRQEQTNNGNPNPGYGRETSIGTLEGSSGRDEVLKVTADKFGSFRAFKIRGDTNGARVKLDIVFGNGGTQTVDNLNVPREGMILELGGGSRFVNRVVMTVSGSGSGHGDRGRDGRGGRDDRGRRVKLEFSSLR